MHGVRAQASPRLPLVWGDLLPGNVRLLRNPVKLNLITSNQSRRTGSDPAPPQLCRRLHGSGRVPQRPQAQGRGPNLLRNHRPDETRRRPRSRQPGRLILRAGEARPGDHHLLARHIAGTHVPGGV